MINTTYNAHEDEILLPRNLKLTLSRISEKTRGDGTTHKVYDIFVEMKTRNQFKIDTGCNKYDIVDIVNLSNSKLNDIKPKVKQTKSTKLKTVPNNVVKNLTDEVVKTKLPDVLKNTTK